ncbi:MAG: AzlC family ABC transporter permease [Lachnospiraceae bacterium]|nr:AzlC family ABC transporter permease [Lachnospiraceae bacterium]
MNSFKKGLVDGVAIGLGYFSVSFTFGLLAVSNGFYVWEAVLISMTNLTSAGQFAGITVMAQAGTLVEMALTQFVINLRYSLMSLSMSQKVDKSMNIPLRLFFGMFHTDEIYAVAIGQKGKVGWKYFAGVIIAPYLGWSLGTLAGAICGSNLPEILCNALGVALYAMFVAIVVPEMKKSRPMFMIVGLAVAMRCFLYYVPFLREHVSSGFAVIICAVVASALGAVFFPIKEDAATEKQEVKQDGC